ncbi:MAG TPA: CPBP family intramembrane glutamic endopeptidase [Candidatus Sulfotelmatobacter sp.]|nr:CPBP family intramembrane glutamic endopeptidase [Candidatus Sulfotelmatobacter sp.]
MSSSQTVVPQVDPGPSHRAVAPAWHTIVILVVLFGVSLAGAINHGLSPRGHAHGRAIGYVVVMIVEWIMVAFIWYGVSRRDLRISDLVGGSWARPIAILRDLGIAIAFLIVSWLVLGGISYLLKVVPNEAIRNLFPHGPAEVVLYLMLAATAGFCEELIFRGYLQRQFTALTRTAAGGIILQGVAFGVSHGYQGWRYMVVIAVFGVLFGLLVQWRRTLRPGMIAHFVQDGVGGLLGSHLPKHIL